MASTSASNNKVNPGSFSEPVGLEQDDLPVRQLHPWCPDFQKAFLLEEIEVPQALDLGVVNRMNACHVGYRKPRSRDEIHVDRQRLLGRVEIDTVGVHGLAMPKAASKSWFCICARSSRALPAPSMARRRSALKDAPRRCAVADGHP